MKIILRIPHITVLSFAIASCIAAITFFDPSLALHLKPLKLTPTGIGLVFLAPSGAYGVMSAVAGRLSDKKLWLSIISLIFLVIGLGMVFTPVFPDMIEAAKKRNIGNDFVVFSVISGLVSAFFSLGEIVGPFIGGSFNTLDSISFDWSSSVLGFVLVAETGKIYYYGTGRTLNFLVFLSDFYFKSLEETVEDHETENNEKTNLLEDEAKR
ncbi:MFS-type transporter SLC18B1 [Trichoplax sp. H2]|nr:MFS-type transporter SLC18B1 [Trichoplax sp. H2]|eukprot:RDD42095.1 MFS-type transporter SLC18B1 [Trichoplax sp. H2]